MLFRDHVNEIECLIDYNVNRRCVIIFSIVQSQEIITAPWTLTAGRLYEQREIQESYQIF